MNKTLVILKVLGKALPIFILTLLLQLVSIIVLPFVLPFIGKDKETLPDFLAWFDNNEIRMKNGKMDDGLAGYPEYRAEMIPKYGLFLTRYIWLALRNPVNYFQYKVLGASIYPRITMYNAVAYDAQVGNKEGEHEGLSILEAVTDVEGDREVLATDVYYVKKLTSTRCVRIRIGHKLKDPTYRDFYIAQFVLTINFAEYEGI